jgi:hypothetical protein
MMMRSINHLPSNKWRRTKERRDPLSASSRGGGGRKRLLLDSVPVPVLSRPRGSIAFGWRSGKGSSSWPGSRTYLLHRREERLRMDGGNPIGVG